MKLIEPDEFVALSSQGYVIVDTRKSEVFSDGFYTGSISIPFNDDFIDSFQELIEDDEHTLIVAAEEDVAPLFKKIKAAGLANVYGYLKGGFDPTWAKNKFLDMLITIDPVEFQIDYRFDEFYLIDVRPADAFAKEHIEYAENLELIDLEQLLIDLDATKSYYVYADLAAQAITAGSLFKRSGFDLTKVVADTFDNIKATEIPLIIDNKKKTPSTKFSKN
jgi:rhodanese-related sulfurtransferase